METTQPQWGQSLKIFRSIIATEGSYRALYRGLITNVVGNSTSWALYFYFYAHTKDLFRNSHPTKPEQPLTSLDYFLASGLAGVATAVLTNPIWVIKSRILSTGANVPGAYTSMLHGIRTILRTEGPRGFWHGLIPSLFGISHGAVQFSAYEKLKDYRRRSHGELSNTDYLVLSGTAKVVAGTVTYPYQVVRVRLQGYEAGRRYGGLADVVGQTWKREGVRGFYKGLGPSIVRVLPSTCVTFLVYENVKFYLGRDGRVEDEI